MALEFTKMTGAGNDFILLDNRDGSLALGAGEIARLCDRHRGIGADGVLMVEPASGNGGSADFRMRTFNADGGEAEMCGNGARCFARFTRRLTRSGGDPIRFETPAGIIGARCRGELVEIEMSAPTAFAPTIRLDVNGHSLPVHFINTGVPHAVVFVTDLESTDVRTIGAAIRRHPHFAPRGTNVNFVSITAHHTIAIRTYERGVEDETLACGTGVVACALIHHIESRAQSPISVRVRGGDTLTVAFQPLPIPGEFAGVTLTGPADFVFDGTIAL